MLNSLHLKRSEDCNLNLITVGKLNTEVNSYVLNSMLNNDYKKGIKTESSNQYTSYALSKLSIIFFSTLAVKQNKHNCKRVPIYSEYR
jgi:hypothetical protein